MLPRPAMRENFRYVNFHDSEKGSHTTFHGTMRRKTFDGKSQYPLIMHEFFRYPKVSETPKCSLMCSLLLWNKIFWQNLDVLHVLSMIVVYINFYWNTDVFPYDFLRHCETICFRRKIEITLPPSLFIHNFFSIPENFWKTERFFYEVFRSWETNKFQQTLYTTHSHAWKTSISEFIWNTDVFPYEVYRHCEKNSREKSNNLSFCISFSIPERFWNTNKIH